MRFAERWGEIVIVYDKMNKGAWLGFGALIIGIVLTFAPEEMTTDFMNTSVFSVTHKSTDVLPCTCAEGNRSCMNPECLSHRKQQRNCASMKEKTKPCGCGKKMGEA